MKLIIAVINKDDSKGLVEKLSEGGFSATKIESQGGFLKKQSNTILIGAEDKRVETIIGLIRVCCKSRSENISPTPQTIEPGELIIPEAERIQTSGAVVFVVDASQFIKL